MKFTLAFDIFNKVASLENLLTSWLSTLSGWHTYEVIVICDACVDGSQAVARDTLKQHEAKLTRWLVEDTPDVYEIAANNVALQRASVDSDLIIFIQDDNYMYSSDWDVTLLEAQKFLSFPGCTALLAGGLFEADGSYHRVESNTPHKGDNFTWHNIPEDQYPPGVYSVDFITRPFAVGTPLLRQMGGLGALGYDIICWDDTDLSIKLLKAGFGNLYVSLDVLNLSSGQETMKERMAQSFTHNLALFNATHLEWLTARDKNNFGYFGPLKEGRLVHSLLYV